MFMDCGYELSFELLNAADYGIPQDRKRVFFVGYRKDLGIKFEFPKPTTPKEKINLKRAIGDLQDSAIPALQGNYTNGKICKIPNHEYMIGGFSSMFMSRNRVRTWDEVSFTIQAGGRHAPIHPQAPKMKFIEQNLREFEKGKEELYRRLSVRECARIQTFPDNFVFHYNSVVAGYKMIGNAVPVRLGQVVAKKIYEDLSNLKVKETINNQKVENRVNGTDVLKRMEDVLNKITA
jgi:DNA (cytosine-5)-methyltransferase 1